MTFALVSGAARDKSVFESFSGSLYALTRIYYRDRDLDSDSLMSSLKVIAG